MRVQREDEVFRVETPTPPVEDLEQQCEERQEQEDHGRAALHEELAQAFLSLAGRKLLQLCGTRLESLVQPLERSADRRAVAPGCITTLGPGTVCRRDPGT